MNDSPLMITHCWTTSKPLRQFGAGNGLHELSHVQCAAAVSVNGLWQVAGCLVGWLGEWLVGWAGVWVVGLRGSSDQACICLIIWTGHLIVFRHIFWHRCNRLMCYSQWETPPKCIGWTTLDQKRRPRKNDLPIEHDSFEILLYSNNFQPFIASPQHNFLDQKGMLSPSRGGFI